MTSSEPGTLVLVGPMGAGKTSVGKRVAKALGLTFTDTDAVFVRRHGAIADVFTDHGEAHFRALEREIVAEAVASGGVVSLGGGAVLSAETRDVLARPLVAFLTVSAPVVASRIRGSKRPLLNDGDPIARWQAIFSERLPLYREVADREFDTSSGPLADVVAGIAEWAAAAGVGSADTAPTHAEADRPEEEEAQ